MEAGIVLLERDSPPVIQFSGQYDQQRSDRTVCAVSVAKTNATYLGHHLPNLINLASARASSTRLAGYPDAHFGWDEEQADEPFASIRSKAISKA